MYRVTKHLHSFAVDDVKFMYNYYCRLYTRYTLKSSTNTQNKTTNVKHSRKTQRSYLFYWPCSVFIIVFHSVYVKGRSVESITPKYLSKQMWGYGSMNSLYWGLSDPTCGNPYNGQCKPRKKTGKTGRAPKVHFIFQPAISRCFCWEF